MILTTILIILFEQACTRLWQNAQVVNCISQLLRSWPAFCMQLCFRSLQFMTCLHACSVLYSVFQQNNIDFQCGLDSWSIYYSVPGTIPRISKILEFHKAEQDSSVLFTRISINYSQLLITAVCPSAMAMHPLHNKAHGIASSCYIWIFPCLASHVPGCCDAPLYDR